MSFLYIYLISFALCVIGAKYYRDEGLIVYAFVPVINMLVAALCFLFIIGGELCKWARK